MSKDAFGNYVCDLPASGYVSNATLGFVGYGSGAPDASTPTWFNLYLDRSTGTVYVNTDGTPTGWTAIVGGGGGGISQGHGAPGAAPAGGVGIYFDEDSGDVWDYWGGQWH